MGPKNVSSAPLPPNIWLKRRVNTFLFFFIFFFCRQRLLLAQVQLDYWLFFAFSEVINEFFQNLPLGLNFDLSAHGIYYLIFSPTVNVEITTFGIR